MMTRNNNNKKKFVALIGAAAITLLIASIAVIGAAQLSYQQSTIERGFTGRGFITSTMIADNTIVSADLRDGAAVRSSDIVDGQVNAADLADDAVTTDKIRDGEVKAEDLDPSIELGGGGSVPSLDLEVTERSNSVTLIEGEDEQGFHTVSVQCNSDEVVTGGGFAATTPAASDIKTSKKQDNGWTITSLMSGFGGTVTLTVYAECLKVVPATE